LLRFVDLGDQIACDDGDTREFAFYDTIASKFVELNTGSTWESWEEFEDDWRHSDLEGTTWTLERFRGLCAKWVFEQKAEQV
jgi:hypothetical protein